MHSYAERRWEGKNVGVTEDDLAFLKRWKDQGKKLIISRAHPHWFGSNAGPDCFACLLLIRLHRPGWRSV